MSSKGPEGPITDAVKRDLTKREKRGEKIFHLKIAGGFFQRSGMPDFIIWQCTERGAVCKALELKGPGKKPTRLQEETLKLLARVGLRTMCTDSIEHALECIEKN